MVSLGSEIRRSLTAYSSRTKCDSMPVMKNNDFESRIVWLARRSSVFAGFLFTTFGFWAWRGVGFLVIIFIFPRFYNRLAKSERRGRARRRWRDGAAGGIATFPLSFSIRLPLNGKLRALRCGTKETNAHKERRMQGRRNGGYMALTPRNIIFDMRHFINTN